MTQLFCPLRAHIPTSAGFGPFQGVPTNPTSILVPLLQPELVRRGESKPIRVIVPNDSHALSPTHVPSAAASHIIRAQIVETSTIGAREALSGFKPLALAGTPTVFLHFGVADSSAAFKLEQIVCSTH